MACLREQTPEERSGTILCDEEGCELRSLAPREYSELDDEALKTYCLLQLRLRARDPENSGFDISEWDFRT